MKIYFSHASSYDYETQLYAPVKSAAMYTTHQIFLPHDLKNRDVKTEDIIRDFDLMIAEVSAASTGQGIEIGLASAAGIPIIGVYKEGSKPSTALRFYCKELILYASGKDFLPTLADILNRKHASG